MEEIFEFPLVEGSLPWHPSDSSRFSSNAAVAKITLAIRGPASASDRLDQSGAFRTTPYSTPDGFIPGPLPHPPVCEAP